MNLPNEMVHIVIKHLQKTAETSHPSTSRGKTQAAADSFNIYSEIKNEEMADWAWQLGFYEVNYHGATDFLPLACSYIDLSGTTVTFYTEYYVLWLLDHGADPFQPLHDTDNPNLSTLAVHKAIHCISQPDWDWDYDILAWEPNRLGYAAHEVARRLCSEPTTDSCLCACSTNGCTPFLILLRNLAPASFDSQRDTSPRPKDYANDFAVIRRVLYQNSGFVCQYEGNTMRLYASSRPRLSVSDTRVARGTATTTTAMQKRFARRIASLWKPSKF